MTSNSNGQRPASGAGTEPPVDQLFAMAVDHHQRGRLADAEGLYRRILAGNPRHADSLHFAGVAALQQARYQEAVDLIERSLSERDGSAEAHYHLGLALAGLRRFDDTAAQNRSAIALKPDYTEAHLNLGNALKELGRIDEAAACYERVIALNPRLAVAHYNLANVLVDKRDLEAANKSFERALSLQPNFPQAQQNYGTSLLLQGRLDEAIDKFNAALAGIPNFVEALVGRAVAFMQKGNAHDALGIICRALDINPTDDAKFLFVDCIRTLGHYSPEIWLQPHLISAINEPWGRPRELAPFAANMLRSTGAVAEINAQSAASGENFKHTRSHLEMLAGDRLLLAVLESAPVVDPQLERILTAARRELLDIAAGNETAGGALTVFACALARQCFVNEYVFDLSDAENALAREQRDRLVATLDAGGVPAPILLAVTASYFPLHGIDGAERLLTKSWPAAADALLTQQLREPLEERRLRVSMPRLTPIDDAVSVQVQQQYEENPYPRWVKIPRQSKAVLFDDYIRKMFPFAPFQPTGKSACDILVAGCGTGQDPLEYAQHIAHAKILALDLSGASLGHAKRKTIELGIHNIDYAQADILKLAALGRTFDFVGVAGVLHHMADPFAAWRDLMALVRPGGVMLLGLYSKAAAAHVLAARAFVAEQGFASTAEGIRLARRTIMALPDGSQVKEVIRVGDFFTTSECRDLLFHVQEQRLEITQINAYIKQSSELFLGFSVRQHIVGEYRTRFPQDPSMTDLDNWHAFEIDNPRTFMGMYMFAVQKPL